MPVQPNFFFSDPTMAAVSANLSSIFDPTRKAQAELRRAQAAETAANQAFLEARTQETMGKTAADKAQLDALGRVQGGIGKIFAPLTPESGIGPIQDPRQALLQRLGEVSGDTMAAYSNPQQSADALATLTRLGGMLMADPNSQSEVMRAIAAAGGQLPTANTAFSANDPVHKSNINAKLDVADIAAQSRIDAAEVRNKGALAVAAAKPPSLTEVFGGIVQNEVKQNPQLGALIAGMQGGTIQKLSPGQSAVDLANPATPLATNPKPPTAAKPVDPIMDAAKRTKAEGDLQYEIGSEIERALGINRSNTGQMQGSVNEEPPADIMSAMGQLIFDAARNGRPLSDTVPEVVASSGLKWQPGFFNDKWTGGNTNNFGALRQKYTGGAPSTAPAQAPAAPNAIPVGQIRTAILPDGRKVQMRHVGNGQYEPVQ